MLAAAPPTVELPEKGTRRAPGCGALPRRSTAPPGPSRGAAAADAVRPPDAPAADRQEEGREEARAAP
eukprot:12650068-Alexandrium_andersonii.AAC.1